MKKVHFSSIREYHDYFDLPAPEHPLISVMSISSDASCVEEEIELSNDFYIISLKHIIEGEIHYGRTLYDFNGSSLICMSPRQTVRIAKLNIKSDAKTILIHEDFLRGTSIQRAIEAANYFTYAVNEALHLSPREENLVKNILDTLELEYNQNHDAFSKDIMVSQLTTLLTYADRFYQRQFQQRMESPMSSLEERFFNCLKALPSDHIPSVEELADKLHVTPRYLSDGLKVETGKTALDNIHAYQIDRAKNMLLGSDDSIATIAYALGFEYPQYFARLFKKKVGQTPTQYRNQYH
ncbi:helix-turn-helix domain-containing protein [Thalassotalea montiporae]